MKQKITFDTEYVYYPVSKEEYILDMILCFIWDVALVSVAIYLSVTYTAWWMLLVFLVSSPDKIKRMERS